MRMFLVVAFLAFAVSAQAQQQVVILPLHHRTVEDVLPVLEPLLEPGGALSGMSGQLIIRASPGNEGLPAGELETSPIALSGDKGRRPVTLYSAGFVLARDGTRYASAMTLLAKDLYYIKGRYSGEAASHTPESLHAELKDFSTRLVRETRLYSTGECWMPPPIVQAAAPDPKAAGALVNIGSEGAARAVGFADRVEAVDAGSSEAAIAQFLAYSTSGRWIAGCNPPEDMTPAVPDGMRELRFEYRAPPERSDGSTPRLRSPRAGVG